MGAATAVIFNLGTKPRRPKSSVTTISMVHSDPDGTYAGTVPEITPVAASSEKK